VAVEREVTINASQLCGIMFDIILETFNVKVGN